MIRSFSGGRSSRATLFGRPAAAVALAGRLALPLCAASSCDRRHPTLDRADAPAHRPETLVTGLNDLADLGLYARANEDVEPNLKEGADGMSVLTGVAGTDDCRRTCWVEESRSPGPLTSTKRARFSS